MSVRVGVIGCGIMGSAVARVYAMLDSVRLVALADVREDAVNALGDELDVAARYTDYRRMLERESLDAVSVATPDAAHTEPVLAALEAGCHVLVEKPLATRQAQAEAICRAVAQTGRKLQVAYNHRWLAPYHKVKELAASGELGDPVLASARKNNPISVPTDMIRAWSAKTTPAWFLSCHDMDLVSWWFDADPVEAYARGVKRVLADQGFDTYDAIQSLVTFAGGRTATFEAAWIYPNSSPYMPDSFMELVGTRGTTQIDRSAEAIDAMLADRFVCPRTFLQYQVFDEWQGAFPACIRAFVRAVEQDTEPYVTARDGLRVTAILEAVHRSLETGRPERIRLGV